MVEKIMELNNYLKTFTEKFYTQLLSSLNEQEFKFTNGGIIGAGPKAQTVLNAIKTIGNICPSFIRRIFLTIGTGFETLYGYRLKRKAPKILNFFELRTQEIVSFKKIIFEAGVKIFYTFHPAFHNISQSTTDILITDAVNRLFNYINRFKLNELKFNAKNIFEGVLEGSSSQGLVAFTTCNKIRLGNPSVLKVNQGSFRTEDLFRQFTISYDEFELLSPFEKEVLKNVQRKLILESILELQDEDEMYEFKKVLLRDEHWGIPVPKGCKWEYCSHGDIPQGAVYGGDDFERQIYVARTIYKDVIAPGKLVERLGSIYFPYDGKENRELQYQVLVVDHEDLVSWVEITDGNIPSNAIQGGITTFNEPLYIGRVNHLPNAKAIGKISSHFKCLFISFGGLQFRYNMKYEILVYNGTGNN